MIIEDMTVLVTGANRGIGKALVNLALARGARRVYASSRQPLTHSDPRVHPVTMDVTDPDQIRRAVGQIASLDILINNAGIMLPDDPFDPAMLERHMAVNLFGWQAITEALLPALITSRGAVVNLCSCAALAPLPMFTSYSISKAAAFSLTKTLRARHAGQEVGFHAVLAGPIDTDMTRDLPIPKASPESAAEAIFDALHEDAEEIFPDPTSAQLAAAWETGADKSLERQLAGRTPAQPVGT